ncbi:hypothetical protein ig2599ANME_1704 [groundwater metagenome]
MPFSCIPSTEGPWHTEAVLSMIPPSSSVRRMPFLWTSHSAEAQPYKRGLFDFASICAAASIASSYETSLNSPFLSVRIIGAFILWCPMIFATPSLHAFFTSIILLFSTNTVMSSHMQPQKGQRASVITVITYTSLSVLSLKVPSHSWHLSVPGSPLSLAFHTL